MKRTTNEARMNDLFADLDDLAASIELPDVDFPDFSDFLADLDESLQSMLKQRGSREKPDPDVLY